MQVRFNGSFDVSMDVIERYLNQKREDDESTLTIGEAREVYDEYVSSFKSQQSRIDALPATVEISVTTPTSKAGEPKKVDTAKISLIDKQGKARNFPFEAKKPILLGDEIRNFCNVLVRSAEELATAFEAREEKPEPKPAATTTTATTPAQKAGGAIVRSMNNQNA